MKKFALSLFVLIAVGCSRILPSAATPVPTVTSVAIAPTLVPPTAAPSPTAVVEADTDTPLPPPQTQAAATDTPQPATNTPIPTTPAPTATNTRRPVTPKPAATATATEAAAPTSSPNKYSAPQLIEPHSGDTREAGKDDLVFKWKPVASLGGNECYLLTLRITNLKTNEYGQQSFIASNTCADSGGSQLVLFTVKKRSPAPDYSGLLSIADKSGTSDAYKATWYVAVIQNNGADPNNPDPSQYTMLSPNSETFEFDLRQ